MARIVALAWLLVAVGCGSTAAPPARPPSASEIAAADARVAADPAVVDCEARLDDCSGIAVDDPFDSWRLGLGRLATARADRCRAGDGDACYRAWQYGLRDADLLRRGCELGSHHACAAAGGADGGALPTSSEGAIVVEATALEAARLRGKPKIRPPKGVRTHMADARRTALTATVKICVDATGVPQRVTMLKSSGYVAYDLRLRNAVATWRYRPFVIDGSAAVVCAAVTFDYAQKARRPIGWGW